MPTKAQIAAHQLLAAEAAKLPPPDPAKVAKAKLQAKKTEIARVKSALENASTDKEKEAINRQLASLTGEGQVMAADPNSDMVLCKVLPLGDGRISTGEHIAGVGELHYDLDDEFMGIRASAEILQARGWLRIL